MSKKNSNELTSRARRKFLKGLGAAGAAVVTSSASWPLIMIPGTARASEKIVIAHWGGRYQETQEEAFFKPFEKETGIPVVLGPPGDLAKLTAMVQTGNVEIDMVDMLSSWIVPGEKSGLWEPIDTSIVDRTNILPKAQRDSVSFYYVSGAGITFDEGRHPNNHPTNWQEFWNVEKFPGRRNMTDRVYEALPLALLADGVPPDQVFPLDVDRAFKSLDKIKPHIGQWLSASAQSISTIEQNESDFNLSYSGRVFASRAAGNKSQFIGKHCYMTTACFAAMKGTKNKDAVMRLMNYINKPEVQARWANLYGNAGTNQLMMDLVDESVKKNMLNTEDPSHVWVDLDYWGDHQEELNTRFKEWLIS